MTDNVVDIESNRLRPASAEEKAAIYKSRCVTILGDLMQLMRDAEREEYRIEFQIQRDPLGVPYFLGPTIVKRFP